MMCPHMRSFFQRAQEGDPVELALATANCARLGEFTGHAWAGLFSGPAVWFVSGGFHCAESNALG